MSSAAKPEARLSSLVRRSEFYTAALVAVMLVALVFAAVMTNPQELFGALKHVGLKITLAVALLALGNYALRLVRFRYLLGRKGVQAPLLPMARIYLAGFAMTATPGKLGEFVRMWFLKRQYGVRYGDALPTVIADRADDVFATVLLCVLTAGSFSNYLLATAILAALMAMVCIVLMNAQLLIGLVNSLYALVRRKPRMFARLRQLVQNTSALFKPAPLVIGITLGCVGWLLEGMAFYICASMFAPLSLAQAVFIFTFANLVGAVTLLPGGVGGTEISMVTLLTTLHFRFEESAAITAVVRIGTLWFGIACGYLALFSWLGSQRGRDTTADRESVI